LPVAYFNAGVREYWLIDARGDEFQFQIHQRGKTGFQPVDPNEEGFQLSALFQHRFRLERLPHPRARWKYVLHDQEC
jgi:Uma2 family endonuclease